MVILNTVNNAVRDNQILQYYWRVCPASFYDMMSLTTSSEVQIVIEWNGLKVPTKSLWLA